MCTHPIAIRLPPNPYERSIGICTDKVLTVPCGRCPECLSKRQKDISIRAYREALKFGNCFFLTLTYNPQHVPFAETLYSINSDTGDCVIDKPARICESPMLDTLRNLYVQSKGLFVHEHSIVNLEDTEYRVVYTPTLNYTDVRLKIKNFRVKYEREKGVKLPKFSYICVGEYGSKRSIRPHYHLLIFGLNFFQVSYFSDMWKPYGYTLIEKVHFKNSDGSDGIAKVASYIGKYAAKGSFVPSTVINHQTVPCRISASRGLGLSELHKLSDFVLCKDLFGDYSLDNYEHIDKNKLFENVFSRLFYDFNGHRVSLPISIRKKIFGFKTVDGVACWSKLYYEVMAFARTQYQAVCDTEFLGFLQKHSKLPLHEAVGLFQSIQDSNLRSREENERKRLRDFYSKSKL